MFLLVNTFKWSEGWKGFCAQMRYDFLAPRLIDSDSRLYAAQNDGKVHDFIIHDFRANTNKIAFKSDCPTHYTNEKLKSLPVGSCILR